MTWEFYEQFGFIFGKNNYGKMLPPLHCKIRWLDQFLNIVQPFESCTMPTKSDQFKEFLASAVLKNSVFLISKEGISFSNLEALKIKSTFNFLFSKLSIAWWIYQC